MVYAFQNSFRFWCLCGCQILTWNVFISDIWDPLMKLIWHLASSMMINLILYHADMQTSAEDVRIWKYNKKLVHLKRIRFPFKHLMKKKKKGSHFDYLWSLLAMLNVLISGMGFEMTFWCQEAESACGFVRASETSLVIKIPRDGYLRGNIHYSIIPLALPHKTAHVWPWPTFRWPQSFKWCPPLFVWNQKLLHWMFHTAIMC